MDYSRFLKELCDLGPRYAEREIQAAKLIEAKLDQLGIAYTVQPFTTTVPICTHAELYADGESILCQGSSMVSGTIPDAKYVVSQFGYRENDIPYNISYNPLSEYPCSADHDDVPSVAVARDSLAKIFMAKDVHGSVSVEKRTVDSENILVGNTVNPRYVVFAHYDSIIGRGAMDNAGSVVSLLRFIEQHRQLMQNNLFVFAGNEELSYDELCKSFYGFRVFESKYETLLLQANKIIVMDGVGVDKPQYCQEWLDWVFYVKNFDAIKEKVLWMQTDQTIAFRVGHTHDDVEKYVKDEYLRQAEHLLADTLTK